MRVLVTGADGFVGQYVLEALRASGHTAVAACRPGCRPLPVPVIPLELADRESVRAAVSDAVDAIVHLAAVAYSPDARADPGQAWNINAAGTARLLAAVVERYGTGGSAPAVIVASTADVYGNGEPRPRRETDPPRPLSPYAASKVGAEVASAQAAEAWRLRAIVARLFPVTGPGQTNRLLPNWVAELRAGKREIDKGDPETVRDYVDVRDAANALLALLERGRAGEIYNVATGRGERFASLFERIARQLGVEARLVPPPANERRPDPPHLVGDPTKLKQQTGWTPQFALDQTLADLIDAQTD